MEAVNLYYGRIGVLLVGWIGMSFGGGNTQCLWDVGALSDSEVGVLVGGNEFCC